MKRYIKSYNTFNEYDYFEEEYEEPDPIEVYKNLFEDTLCEEFKDEIIPDYYTKDRNENPIDLNAISFIITDIKEQHYNSFDIYFTAIYPNEKPLQGYALFTEDSSVGMTLGINYTDDYEIDFSKWGWK